MDLLHGQKVFIIAFIVFYRGAIGTMGGKREGRKGQGGGEREGGNYGGRLNDSNWNE